MEPVYQRQKHPGPRLALYVTNCESIKAPNLIAIFLSNLNSLLYMFITTTVLVFSIISCKTLTEKKSNFPIISGVNFKRHFGKGAHREYPSKRRYRYPERFGEGSKATYRPIEISFIEKMQRKAYWDVQVPKFTTAAFKPRHVLYDPYFSSAFGSKFRLFWAACPDESQC
jgi:hypothetical protein